LARWIYVTYANGTAAAIPAFVQPAEETDSKGSIKREKKALLEQYAQQEVRMAAMLAELEQERAKREAVEKTVEQLTAEGTKGQKTALDVLKFNEATTRKRLIDSQLADAGWNIGADGANTSEVTQEEKLEHQPTTTGFGYADYVLWDDNGLPLAVIEAKKTAESVEKGRTQARCYADGMEKMHGQRPVIFYTNGYDIEIWDDAQNYPPRKLYGYYSKDSLQYLVRQRKEKQTLDSATPRKEILGNRLYQYESIKRTAEAFTLNKRKALIVQATGTGKTRVAIALADLLMKTGWVKRVLFLCDRKELRKQAKNNFNDYINAPIKVLTSKNSCDQDDRIFLATYPAMLNCYAQFDVGFFDLIIADESHRSIYNIYGDLFRYFDALQVGLTATPVEMISRSTCGLFGCDFKHPTSNYPLEQAVLEEYLVPYKVVKHTTKFMRDGIKGDQLTPEQIAELEDKGIDPNTLDFDAKDIDRAIYNKDTNRKILQNLMENGVKLADGQTLGKSIIFSRNHEHAKLLENLFNDMYPQYGGKFCQVIDNYDPRAEELIDDFKGNGSNMALTIAISVDMLDTGIDVPEVVNIVFARPVKSPVKFWQMLGRGTRLCLNLFGAGNHKTHFLVFDHWGVVEYHGVKQREVEISNSKSLMQRVFEARLNLAKVCLSNALVDEFDASAQWLCKAINGLDEKSISVRDKWRIKRQMGELETLRSFAPNTVVILETEIAPLMQWVDIRGHVDAYKWDLLLSDIAIEKINKSTRFDDLVADALGLLHNLQMHLNPVKAKAKLLQPVREKAWWVSASLAELEEVRAELRDILQYQQKNEQPAWSARVTDITDGEEIRENQKTYLAAIDMKAYQVQVEAALREVFDTDPVIQKIRDGKPVSEQELEQLNGLILTRHPEVSLHTLKQFYDSATGLDQILRSIVGMNAEIVNEKFAKFVQQYPSLNSSQIKFLNLLQNQIAKHGAITVAALYDAPFTTLHAEGLEGVFPNGEAADQLVALVEEFGVPV
jgi:type I restriction enzyme R subunit